MIYMVVADATSIIFVPQYSSSFVHEEIAEKECTA